MGHNREDKWICRNWPLSAETPPTQTGVILMAFEVKGNPNPHIPPTQVSDSTTQPMHRELGCSTNNKGSGTREMKRNGRREVKENSRAIIQEQHNHAVSLSISKFNFMLKWENVWTPHLPFGSFQYFSVDLCLWNFMRKMNHFAKSKPLFNQCILERGGKMGKEKAELFGISNM